MPASKSPPTGRRTTSSRGRAVPAGLSALAEQLVNRIIKPLGLVILSQERIQQTLDEAVQRGRVTRTDANHLVAVLVDRGRRQTEELLSDLEGLLGRGRQQFDATIRAGRDESVDRLKRGAHRARRTVGVGRSFPITDYDDLTAVQVQQRLRGLEPAELRTVRAYECRHANRKTVLAAIHKRLG